MTFGEKLRQYRTQKGLTQAELAKKAGLGLNTITNYEKGKTYPQNRKVYTVLAAILGVNVNDLKNESDDFIAQAGEMYGSRGASQAESLIKDAHALFAGGELSDADKDGVMLALQDAYWVCKRENTEKYGKRKKHSFVLDDCFEEPKVLQEFLQDEHIGTEEYVFLCALLHDISHGVIEDINLDDNTLIKIIRMLHLKNKQNLSSGETPKYIISDKDKDKTIEALTELFGTKSAEKIKAGVNSLFVARCSVLTDEDVVKLDKTDFNFKRIIVDDPLGDSELTDANGNPITERTIYKIKKSTYVSAVINGETQTYFEDNIEQGSEISIFCIGDKYFEYSSSFDDYGSSEEIFDYCRKVVEYEVECRTEVLDLMNDIQKTSNDAAVLKSEIQSLTQLIQNLELLMQINTASVSVVAKTIIESVNAFGRVFACDNGEFERVFYPNTDADIKVQNNDGGVLLSVSDGVS